MNVLLCTLGGSWAVVPEIWGMFPENSFELYQEHPNFEDIVAQRTKYRLQPISKIVCISTWGQSVQKSQTQLQKWSSLAGVSVDLHKVKDTFELDSTAQCLTMKEALLRHVLWWREKTKHLYLSLAGGRKTMSSDLQRAATFFGCEGLFHVVDKQVHDKIPQFIPEELAQPVPVEKIQCFMPIYMGQERGQQIWKKDIGDYPALRALDFPIDSEKDSKNQTLQHKVEQRSRAGESLLVNFSQDLMRQDLQNNFLALYRLSPDLIDRLKNFRLGIDPTQQQQELSQLQTLPKAELHCHLGGIADVAGLVRIAQANDPAISQESCSRFQKWRQKLTRQVKEKNKEALRQVIGKAKELPDLFPDVREPLAVAALILAFANDLELLDACIFDNFLDEVAFGGIGIKAYEKLGDLQGSSLLQNEVSLRAACQVLKDYCQNNTVRYLELRCSPEKYTRGGLTSRQVVQILLDALAGNNKCQFRLIFIASRHGCPKELKRHVELALALLKDKTQAVVGFDLAGDESAMAAAKLRKELMPLMEKCLYLTIHAGETMPASSIWEAIYHLNADRIGHGLKLVDEPDLMAKVRDRRIALEMCPSSNFQIIGFQDNYFPTSKHKTKYPLKKYMNEGLRVTISTDNPGISRTNITQELHRACRLTPGGLSLWEVLILVRQGFRAIFAQDVRRELLLEAEKEIAHWVLNTCSS